MFNVVVGMGIVVVTVVVACRVVTAVVTAMVDVILEIVVVTGTEVEVVGTFVVVLVEVEPMQIFQPRRCTE